MPVVATGGIQTTVSGYKYHVFTGVGEGVGPLVVTTGGNVEVLVVAGGGAGGTFCGGAGGAGGVLYEAVHAITAKEYTITVGAGGPHPSTNSPGSDGEDSVFDDMTAIKGGGGANYNVKIGRNGGSGGGGAYGTNAAGGTGTAGPPRQGYDGGVATAGYLGGGGGGSAEAGNTNGNGHGGDGTSAYSDLLIAAGMGVDVGGVHYIAGGGGGWVNGNDAAIKPGGAGGGGAGGSAQDQSGTLEGVAGTPNTGSGGGGGHYSDYSLHGGAGGSGVIIIKYSETDPPIDIALASTLDDVVSNFLLSFSGLNFEDITVEFSLLAETFDDFAVMTEYQAVCYKDLEARFELVQVNAYDYEDISVLFETLLGETYEDVSVIFSIVKESQSFKSYILQKLYCVVSYIGGYFYYDVVLENWNVSPNKTWFVSVLGYYIDEYETGNLITLYDTLTDLQNHTNAVSYGYLDTVTLEVVLEPVDEYDEAIPYYYQDLKYHLMLSGIVAEGEEYLFKVKPLTDLDEIRHPIYNNSNIALSRGEAELDLHTYAVIGRELVLGTHIPELEPGETVNLTSVRRGETSKKSQILGETIAGTINEDGTASLITSINVANYLELSR